MEGQRGRLHVVFGSGNASKRARMRALFAPLGIDLVRPSGMPAADVVEGDDIEHNARMKARAYAQSCAVPCIANDYALRLEGLPAGDQPHARVRRLSDGSSASDGEMMGFYRERLEALGGSTVGTWTGALAVALDPDDVVTTVASHSRRFVSVPSPVVLPGEPLASLQIDPATGRYVSELPFDERAEQRSPIDDAFLAFVRTHLGRLRRDA